MDELFHYLAIMMIGVQVLWNTVIVTVGVVELARPASRRKYQGEDRMAALNRLAFSAASLMIAIILAKLFYDGTIGAVLLVMAAVAIDLVHLAINYFYTKRVPSPETLETKNRYLPNTTAQAFLEEAQLLSEKQSQPEATIDKD